jgi:hypothetical protein
MGLVRGLMMGAAAGAAGTTALDASTYLDMGVRGREPSSAPVETVEKLSDRVGVTVPGDRGTRSNRVSGLGSLNGILVGIGVGAGLGGAEGVGWRPSTLTAGVVAAVVAMAVTDASMALLGVTNPRTWSRSDWLSDALPHLAYGLVAAVTLHALTKEN